SRPSSTTYVRRSAMAFPPDPAGPAVPPVPPPDVPYAPAPAPGPAEAAAPGPGTGAPAAMPAGRGPTPEVQAPILALRDEVGKVVVGQEGTLSGLVAALLVGGHVLLEGVPGTAKTLIVKAVAAALDLDFTRIQFTPDLMPSDVIGQVIFEPRDGSFRF